MKEKDLLNWTIACAEQFGWLVKHVPAPMVAGKGEWRPYKKAAGLPDLFLIHTDPPRLIIAELKGDNGKLSDAQREFLQAAKEVAERSWSPPFLNRPDATGLQSSERTVGVYAWTPHDQSTIEIILRTRTLI